MTTPRRNRARRTRMWADKPHYGKLKVRHTLKGFGGTLYDPYPVYVVPATPEAMEEMVERVANAILAHQDFKPFRPISAIDRKIADDVARAALAAILPLPRTRKRRE